MLGIGLLGGPLYNIYSTEIGYLKHIIKKLLYFGVQTLEKFRRNPYFCFIFLMMTSLTMMHFRPKKSMRTVFNCVTIS